MMPNEVEDTVLLRAANNVLLLLVSRLAMIATPFVATLLVYLGSFWFTSQFAVQNARLEALSVKVDSYQNQVATQAATINELRSGQALTSQSAQFSTATFAAWQLTINTRLDKITDSINNLTSSVAVLEATIKRNGAPP